MVMWALTNTAVAGPLNAAAPHPITNLEFTRTLGRVLRRPTLLPAPAFVLRAVLGEMSSMILESQRMLPAKATDLGFRFSHPHLEQALREIYSS
jgi:NAD dependent epimerase/dehydratase family enzyme